MWKGITSFMKISQAKGDLPTYSNTWLLAGILSAATLVFSGCERPIEDISSEVLPPGEIVEMIFTDTIGIQFETYMVDSTDSYQADRQLVGLYYDTHFGRIQANTYTQVLSRADLNLGVKEDLLYDSLTLSVEFDAVYGDTDEPMVIQAFEITGEWPDDSLISSSTSLPYDMDNPLTEPFELDFANGENIIEVRVTDVLGQRLLFADSDTLGDRDLFLDLFKGIVFIAQEPKFFTRDPGAVYYLVGPSDNTQLNLHYRKRDPDLPTVFRATIEPFLITTGTPRFHEVIRTDISSRSLGTFLSTPDTEEFVEFNQGVGLIHNYVKINGLEDLGTVGISRAELEIRVETDFLSETGRYIPPTEIVAIPADENGNPLREIDGIPVRLTPTSTTYNSSTQTYNFVLTDYVQEIVSGLEENNGFYLEPIDRDYRLNRVVFGGNGHPTLAPIFKLTYSTLPQ